MSCLFLGNYICVPWVEIFVTPCYIFVPRVNTILFLMDYFCVPCVDDIFYKRYIFCSFCVMRVVPRTQYSCSLIFCSLRRWFLFSGHNIFVPWVDKICSSDTIFFVPCIDDICSMDTNFLFLEFHESCSSEALFLFPDFLFPKKMMFVLRTQYFVPWAEKICSSNTIFVPYIDDICSTDANFLFLEFDESCSSDALFLFPDFLFPKKKIFFRHNIFVPWVEKICSSDTIFVPCIYDICSTDADFLFLEFDESCSYGALFLFPDFLLPKKRIFFLRTQYFCSLSRKDLFLRHYVCSLYRWYLFHGR
jgi:hypothetical protein